MEKDIAQSLCVLDNTEDDSDKEQENHNVVGFEVRRPLYPGIVDSGVSRNYQSPMDDDSVGQEEAEQQELQNETNDSYDLAGCVQTVTHVL
ncbi:hypothetical protein OGAPHI_004901 [Ogataea philodendri]|uniref:Uncharacterized protein n=1 Tax=Ogataea philodendri TaxID=1378263 RepID=A0A9P8T304_9ASCO|nr:uncharacterized protein OGAPHI_004901 [Ogataea philodendri]KAH3663500.1 hypothetical protein OGAPHI_004901 [Ogataea philodendri]